MAAWQTVPCLTHGDLVLCLRSCELAVTDWYSCDDETSVDIPKQSDACAGKPIIGNQAIRKQAISLVRNFMASD